jgi:hypothetical protein
MQLSAKLGFAERLIMATKTLDKSCARMHKSKATGKSQSLWLAPISKLPSRSVTVIVTVMLNLCCMILVKGKAWEHVGQAYLRLLIDKLAQMKKTTMVLFENTEIQHKQHCDENC